MKPILYDIRLDCKKNTIDTIIQVKQYDLNTRVVRATLTDGADLVDLTDTTVVLAATKPDGTTIYNDCEIENGYVLYTFTSQTTAALGEMECEFQVYNQDETEQIITSQKFIIYVGSVIKTPDSILSSDEFLVLTSLITGANGAINQSKEWADASQRSAELAGDYADMAGQEKNQAMQYANAAKEYSEAAGNYAGYFEYQANRAAECAAAAKESEENAYQSAQEALQYKNEMQQTLENPAHLDENGRLCKDEIPDIDCGIWDANEIAEHDASAYVHMNMIIDGNVTDNIDTSTTLEEHLTNHLAHQNMVLDGNDVLFAGVEESETL